MFQRQMTWFIMATTALQYHCTSQISAARGNAQAFLRPVVSELHSHSLAPSCTLFCTVLSRCSKRLKQTYTTIALCAAALLMQLTRDAGARIRGFALCNSLYEAEFLLDTPFTLVELLLKISLAPNTASVWPTICNAHYWWIPIHL